MKKDFINNEFDFQGLVLAYPSLIDRVLLIMGIGSITHVFGIKEGKPSIPPPVEFDVSFYFHCFRTLITINKDQLYQWVSGNLDREILAPRDDVLKGILELNKMYPDSIVNLEIAWSLITQIENPVEQRFLEAACEAIALYVSRGNILLFDQTSTIINQRLPQAPFDLYFYLKVMLQFIDSPKLLKKILEGDVKAASWFPEEDEWWEIVK